MRRTGSGLAPGDDGAHAEAGNTAQPLAATRPCDDRTVTGAS
jgi:hypothetical protein